jgi:hypothetical protein
MESPLNPRKGAQMFTVPYAAAQLNQVATECPNRKPIGMFRPDDFIKNVVVAVDCNSWSCPYCREKRRAGLKEHCANVADDYKTVYILADVHEDDCNNMRRRVKRRGGRCCFLRTGSSTWTVIANVDFDAATERMSSKTAKKVIDDSCDSLAFVKVLVIRKEVVIDTLSGKRIHRPERVGYRCLNVFRSCREDSLKKAKDKINKRWKRSNLSVSRQVPFEFIAQAVVSLGMKVRRTSGRLYFWMAKSTTAEQADSLRQQLQVILSSYEPSKTVVDSLLPRNTPQDSTTAPRFIKSDDTGFRLTG